MRRPLAARSLLLAGLAGLFAGPVARGSELADALRSQWLGAWVVVEPDVGSGCNDLFTNNRVLDARTVHSAPHRLAAGELGKVVKLDVKRARIDVFVELAERLRISRIEGPFELFEQTTCRVELQVVVPRAVVRERDVAAANEILAPLLERHQSRELATASPSWNRRRVEALPADYQQTLEAHREWLETRQLAELWRRLDEALEQALEIIERARRSESFAEGMVAGLERARGTRPGGSCEELTDARAYPVSGRAPEGYEGRDERDWEDGYREAQRLVFALELADRLEICLR